MRFHPFRALRPPADLAEDVASPPYDVVTTDEARVLAYDNPQSFLHIIRPEIGLPEGTDLYADAVYARGREQLDYFRRQGWLVRDEEPAFYAYRQQLGEHVQTGIVGCCHAPEYEADVIRKHEYTLRSKEDDRTRHTETLMANGGPVFLTYRDVPAIHERVLAATGGEPEVVFDAEDGVRHSVWPLRDTEAIEARFAEVAHAYVADGHHRSASAVRVARGCREANPSHSGEEPYNFFLCVLFPESELQVLAYNRVVRELNGLTPAQLLQRLGERFTVTPTEETAPSAPGSIMMFLEGRWHELRWRPDVDADPVARLDVSVLQEQVLRPVLGIGDVKTDPRIYFLGGIHGTRKLQEEVESGRGAVAFSLFPVAVGQIMDVADAGAVMPPKSTWFEPKLRSGLFVNLLEN